ncbi:hypothetical protein BS47DRAFT_1335627, partial [Hydnum rufescens UP504]
MARYSIHDSTRVSQFTQSQLTSLTAFLSSLATSPRPRRTPLAAPKHGLPYSAAWNVGSRPAGKMIRILDELVELEIENEL